MLALHYDVTDSTNTRAAQIALLNPGKTVLVSARTQTAGRGRSGRGWQSPPGGAWFSVAHATSAPPAKLQAAPLVAGLAVRRILAAVPGVREHELRLKWPNDVLLRDRKLAGILCERTLAPNGSGGGGGGAIVVGVGINANVDTASLAGELRHPPISLLEATDAPVNITRLIAECADEIEAGLMRLESAGFTRRHAEEFNEHLAWRDAAVTLQHGPHTLEGCVDRVDHDGRLVLRVGDEERAFAAGEVSRLKAAPRLAAACA